MYTMAERISPKHARAIAFWAAAVVMSCLFGAGHLFNPGETAPGIAAVFLAGMVFSYALWHTGSLWWAIGFHMAWDWAQSFLYGVPDSGFLSAGRLLKTHPMGNPLLSGGTTGPEGSVLRDAHIAAGAGDRPLHDPARECSLRWSRCRQPTVFHRRRDSCHRLES